MEAAERALKAAKEAKDKAAKLAYESARDQLKKRNQSLAGKKHPVSGVPFDENGFPDFTGYLYGGKNKHGKNVSEVQIEYTGDRRKDRIRANVAAGYDDTPDGYVWHHDAQFGKIQLVDEVKHAETGHSGGFELSQTAIRAGGRFDPTIGAAEKVLNSHTMRALELFDPTTYLDRMYESQTGYGIFDTEEERWEKFCGSSPESCS